MMVNDEVVIATLYIVFALILGLIYVLSLVAICRDEEMIRQPCYKIMLALGISDLGLLCMMAIFSAIFAFVINDAENTRLAAPQIHVLGALCISFWWSSSALSSLLAVDRFLTIWDNGWSQMCFGHRKIYFAIGACALYAAVSFTVHMVPGYEIIYYPRALAFGHGSRTALYYFNMTQNATTICVVGACHILVLTKLRKLVEMISIGSPNHKEFCAFAAPFLYGTLLLFTDSYSFVMSFVIGQFSDHVQRTLLVTCNFSAIICGGISTVLLCYHRYKLKARTLRR